MAIRQAVADDLPSVRAARRGVTLRPAFDDWFRKATTSEPKHRPEPATAVIAGLADALGVPAPPALIALQRTAPVAPRTSPPTRPVRNEIVRPDAPTQPARPVPTKGGMDGIAPRGVAVGGPKKPAAAAPREASLEGAWKNAEGSA